MDELLKLLSDDAATHTRSGRLGYQRIKELEIARSREIDLSKRYPQDIGGPRRLALIDQCLAAFRERDARRDEARSLTEESVKHWKACLALAPDDLEIHQKLLEQTATMLLHLGDTKNAYLYETWDARAIAILERLRATHEAHAHATFVLSGYHHRHASVLMLRGEIVRARKVLEDDLDLVKSLSGAETASPVFVSSEASALAALGRWSGEFGLIRSPIQAPAKNFQTHQTEPALAELTARRIGWLPSIVKSAWLIPPDLPTDEWTDRVVISVQSDATKFGLDRTRVPAIAYGLWWHGATALASQRKLGKLADAHRIVDQWLALAERLAQSYPDHAARYVFLSDGYVQRAKIAYLVEDEPVIEWERKAFNAAIHAATQESAYGEAHRLVEDRRSRLNKLAAK